MLITYDSDKGTVTVDELEPVPVQNAAQALQVFQAAAGEIATDRNAESETLVTPQSSELSLPNESEIAGESETAENEAMMVAAGENPKMPGKNKAGYQGSY